MERRYVTVDVFTDQRFGGNPLAVVLDAEGLDTAAMQAITREFNYSETTFVLPPTDPAHTAHVRIFTPLHELPFAGHPNVGTAFVLANEGAQADRLLFEEAAGLVPVAVFREGGTAMGAELTAPQPLTQGPEVTTAEAAAWVSLDGGDVVATRHPPVVAGMGVSFVFVELASRDALSRARLDMAAWHKQPPPGGTGSIYLYTRDGGGGFDLHARMLWLGASEDPATGSAAVALAALLAKDGQDGETRLRIEQGRDMGRPSTLLTRTVTQGGTLSTAHVGGGCVKVMRGTIAA